MNLVKTTAITALLLVLAAANADAQKRKPAAKAKTIVFAVSK